MENFEHESDNIKSQKRDSGVDLSEKKSSNVRVKNCKSRTDPINGDVHFKSGMIFDLEM